MWACVLLKIRYPFRVVGFLCGSKLPLNTNQKGSCEINPCPTQMKEDPFKWPCVCSATGQPKHSLQELPKACPWLLQEGPPKIPKCLGT